MGFCYQHEALRVGAGRNEQKILCVRHPRAAAVMAPTANALVLCSTRGVRVGSKEIQEESRQAWVPFDDAKTVFDDDLFLVFADPDHSTEESRFIIMDQSKQGRVLVVAYTERSDAIRIISAREATRHERKIYAEEI